MTDIEVRGGPTDEELAALLAALASGGPGPRGGREDGYARWRRGRRRALAGGFLARR
jgi:hypothetical protein